MKTLAWRGDDAVDAEEEEGVEVVVDEEGGQDGDVEAEVAPIRWTVRRVA